MSAGFSLPERYVGSVFERRLKPIGNTFLNWHLATDEAEKQARPHSFSGYIPCTDHANESQTGGTPTSRMGSKTIPRIASKLASLEIGTFTSKATAEDEVDTPTTRCNTSCDSNAAESEEGDSASLGSEGSREITTLMLRNLPETLLQQHFVNALNKSGFLGLYDFLYMPSIFSTGAGKGYAFVNFVSPFAAQMFIRSCEGRNPFGRNTKGRVSVSPAHIQGRDANIAKWNTRKMARVRNPNHRPVIPTIVCTPTDTALIQHTEICPLTA